MSGGGGSTEIKDTASQKALASIAAQRFNLYQQYYVPLENEFMANVAAMRDPASFENVEGYINAAQQPQFQQAVANMQQQAFSQGVDPTSGQFQARQEQMAAGQARGMGVGTAEGLSGQLDRYYQGMQNIVAMGQGQAGQAIAGLSDVGELAQRRGIAEAKQSFQSSQGAQSVIGTGIGLGAGLYMGTRDT